MGNVVEDYCMCEWVRELGLRHRFERTHPLLFASVRRMVYKAFFPWRGDDLAQSLP